MRGGAASPLLYLTAESISTSVTLELESASRYVASTFCASHRFDHLLQIRSMWVVRSVGGCLTRRDLTQIDT